MSQESLRGREILPFEDMWSRLRRDGYVVTADQRSEVGFDSQFREHVLEKYFNSGQLQLESYDIFPPDRERARDLVRYSWSDKGVHLEEYGNAAIGNRSYSATVREYPHVELLRDPMFVKWITQALTAIPPERRQAEGTFGINLFRTHSDVVSGPHQDDEEFVTVYVVGKHGGGAETSLYEIDSTTPFYSTILSPGERIVFDDQRFFA